MNFPPKRFTASSLFALRSPYLPDGANTATDARTGAKQLCYEGLARLGLMRVSGDLWRVQVAASLLMLCHPFAGNEPTFVDLTVSH